MQHTAEYANMLGVIKRSHKASLSNVSFLLGLFSGDLTPEEYAELHALLVTK